MATSKISKKYLRRRYVTLLAERDKWRDEANRLRAVVDRLESDYTEHRNDCCLWRSSAFESAIRKAIVDATTIVEGFPNRKSNDVGDESSASESTPLIGAASRLAELGRNVAVKTDVESMKREELEEVTARTEAKLRHQKMDYENNKQKLDRLAEGYELSKSSSCCLCPCLQYGVLEDLIRQVVRNHAVC